MTKLGQNAPIMNGKPEIGCLFRLSSSTTRPFVPEMQDADQLTRLGPCRAHQTCSELWGGIGNSGKTRRLAGNLQGLRISHLLRDMLWLGILCLGETTAAGPISSYKIGITGIDSKIVWWRTLKALNKNIQIGFPNLKKIKMFEVRFLKNCTL